VDRPDITAYVPDDLLRQRQPDFPPWAVLLKEFRGLEKQGKRPSFKKWLARRAKVDFSSDPRLLGTLLGEMQRRGLPGAADLPRVVKQILATAADEL
jgi:hypothetical protein